MEAQIIQDHITASSAEQELLRTPVKTLRQGWEEALQTYPSTEQEFADFKKISSSFDETEWTWPQTKL